MYCLKFVPPQIIFGCSAFCYNTPGKNLSGLISACKDILQNSPRLQFISVKKAFWSKEFGVPVFVLCNVYEPVTMAVLDLFTFG